MYNIMTGKDTYHSLIMPLYHDKCVYYSIYIYLFSHHPVLCIQVSDSKNQTANKCRL